MLEKDGFVSCLPLKLIQMRRSVLNRMVQEGNWDIVGRGRDHHPLASDDQELLSAIAQLNRTANSTQKQKRNITSVTSDHFQNRQLLSVDNSYGVFEFTSIGKLLRKFKINNKGKTKEPQIAKYVNVSPEGVRTTHYQTGKSEVLIQAESEDLNKQQGFAEPAMVPFIMDSDDFVYVLVRRTAYLEWNKNKAGFKKVLLGGGCKKQQNIDRELSQLITF